MIDKCIYNLPKESLQALENISKTSILFAHHSVGNNIISGLQYIAAESHSHLHVKSLTHEKTIDSAAFIHFSPGKNGIPESKIDGFSKTFKENQEKINTKIAFLKFCYVDFIPGTLFQEVFNHYKKTIVQLQREYPNITFIHFTVPLTAISLTYKDRLKRFFGFQVWGDTSNLIRKNYNDLLLTSFPEDPIFNIAKVESTHLDGERESTQLNGQTIYCLAPEFTNDGGHLNILGQKVVASELAIFINNILKLKVQ